MEILFIVGRILFGGFFVLNAYNHLTKTPALSRYAASKGVPSPKAFVLITGLMILLGGLGVIFGVYVKFALWLIVLFLVPTSIVMHAFWKEKDSQTKMLE